MEYMTAASYRDYERIGTPYVKDGKMYTKVKEICPRCSGHGIIIARVENGQPIPIPVDGGVCYQCLGKRYFIKEVRLYTEAEAARLEAAKERAAAKREADRRAKMEAEYEQKKAQWLEKNGWTQDGKTYVVTGDSYSIKDELKAAGFRFDLVLKWHKADPGDYADRCVEIDLKDVIEMSAWGEGHYLTSAQAFVANKIAPAPSADEAPSEWIGEVGQRLPLTVTLVRKGYCNTRFGGTNIYSFKCDGNDVTWFSTVILDKEVGDTFKIKATIKSHDEYKGRHQTIITRAKEI